MDNDIFLDYIAIQITQSFMHMIVLKNVFSLLQNYYQQSCSSTDFFCCQEAADSCSCGKSAQSVPLVVHGCVWQVMSVARAYKDPSSRVGEPLRNQWDIALTMPSAVHVMTAVHSRICLYSVSPRDVLVTMAELWRYEPFEAPGVKLNSGLLLHDTNQASSVGQLGTNPGEQTTWGIRIKMQ